MARFRHPRPAKLPTAGPRRPNWCFSERRPWGLAARPPTTTATVVDSPPQLVANNAVIATFQNSVIAFTSGAFANQVWTKLDLPTDYTNPAGARVHITQSGNALTFSDRNGTQSAGT